MFTSLRRLCKAAIADYQGKPRTEWVIAGHPSQVRLLLNFSLGAWSGADSTCMGGGGRCYCRWSCACMRRCMKPIQPMYEGVCYHLAHVWGGMLLQVILTISQIMWCRDLTESLECEGDNVDALEDFEQVNFEVSPFPERHWTRCHARWSPCGFNRDWCKFTLFQKFYCADNDFQSFGVLTEATVFCFS